MDLSRHSQIGTVMLVVGLFILGCESPLGPDDDNGEIASLFGERIVGIDEGAGIMAATEDAMDTYGLDDYELESGSHARMTEELRTAVENQEPIIVTAWTPSPFFSAYDLKFLDDPELVYGEPEDIHAVVRNDLETDDPSLYAFVQAFADINIEHEVIDSIFARAELDHDGDLEAAAQAWAGDLDNASVIDEWIPSDFDDTNGESTFDLAHTVWAEGVAQAELIKEVIESHSDRTVELHELGAAEMWNDVSTGDADAHLQAWLPGTHGAYKDAAGEDVEILDPHMPEAGRIGLAVPGYVTEVDSIADLAE